MLWTIDSKIKQLKIIFIGRDIYVETLGLIYKKLTHAYDYGELGLLN